MKKIIAIFWLPVTILIFNFTPLAISLYANVYWFDKLMHTLGGLSMSYMFVMLMQVYGEKWWGAIPLFWKFIFGIMVAALFGVVWEWYEFLSDLFFYTHNQPSLSDTMYDLLFDLIGSALFMCFFCFSIRHKRK